MVLHDRLRTALRRAMAIKNVLNKSIATTNKERKSALRIVLGELARSDKKEITDEEVIKVLRKFQKDEKYIIGKGKDTVFLRTIEAYLPKQMSKDEIREYLLTIDLSNFKHKAQAMGFVMMKLKGKANGKDVKEVLFNM